MSFRYTTERSPSNRAICRNCRNKITKGTLRLKVYEGFYYGNHHHFFVCTECAIKQLYDEAQDIDIMIDKFERALRDDVCLEIDRRASSNT